MLRRNLLRLLLILPLAQTLPPFQTQPLAPLPTQTPPPTLIPPTLPTPQPRIGTAYIAMLVAGISPTGVPQIIQLTATGDLATSAPPSSPDVLTDTIAYGITEQGRPVPIRVSENGVLNA